MTELEQQELIVKQFKQLRKPAQWEVLRCILIVLENEK